MGVLSLFPAMDYQTWYALGEFVDNSLASFEEDEQQLLATEGEDYRLQVAIEIEHGSQPSITIRDNAGGIPERHYSRAFETARLPSDRPDNALRQFGVGMKAAACWFANNWSVRTTALGESVERTVSFDVQEIVSSGTESLVPTVRDCPAENHYTVIELSSLNQVPRGRNVKKIKTHLSSMYRQFLRTGRLELLYDGEPLHYETPQILTAPPAGRLDAEPRSWKVEVDVGFTGGQLGQARASGWVAIRETGSTRTAGLALLKDERLILGSDDDAYRPEEIFGSSNSFVYQRLFGEIDLEGVPLTHSKNNFRWLGGEEAFVDALRSALTDPVDLIGQARDYRAKHAQKNVVDRAQRAVENTVEDLGGALPDRISAWSRAAAESQSVAEEELPGHTTFERTLEISVGGQAWVVELALANDPSVSEWLSFTDSVWTDASRSPRELRVRLNLAHPFLMRFGSPRGDEMEAIVRLAAVLMLAEVTIRQGLNPDERALKLLRARTNELLRDIAERWEE